MPKAPGPPHSNFHQPQHNQLPPFQSSHYNPSYRSSPQVSPLSTMSTSTGSSPTSPKPRCARQLPPSYIPAVLRPTQHSCKAPYPRPKAEEGAADDEQPPRSSGSFISLPGLAAIGISRLSRRSTGDSGKCIDGSWNLDQFPEVNGLPSRDHWKPDADSTICDEPTCKRHFTYFNRRHHCRRCGNIFCDMHSAFEVPLDESANYNPRGSPSRSCSHCYKEFKSWRSRANSQSSSTSSSVDSQGPATPLPQHTSATAPASPVAAGACKSGGLNPPKAPAEVAMSVPRDWNWSTF